MYSEPFYITEPVGNNSFGQPTRNGRSLFVPKIIKGNFEDLKIGDGIAFEEIDEEGKIISFRGLKNFIEIDFGGVPTYIFDNHNHAYFFWNQARIGGIIKGNSTLVHIDEHSDMREPEIYLDESEINESSKAFEYTNYVLNVGNYIKPAIRSGIIKKIHNIQSEDELDEISGIIEKIDNDVILNLDLDFFSPEMEYIDYRKKKRIILEISRKAKLITISTSPFFIDQQKAIDICKGIFK